MLAVLRPHPHRGDIVAAGAVVLTVFVVLVNGRFGGEWSDLARLLFTLVFAVAVIAMAVQADAGDDVPRPYESILFVTAFLHLLLVLGNLAAVLDGDGPGTVVWAGILLGGFALWLARAHNSAIMTLLAALTGVVVVIALVDWIFDIGSATTVEWLLLLCALALVAGAVYLRDARRRHAVSLADAAGISILALGAVVAAELVFTQLAGVFAGAFGAEPERFAGGPAGWELVLLGFGFGLIAYGCVDRERVPAFIGVLVLGVFLLLAATPGQDGPSLIGWPVVLVLMAIALLAIGLRPRRELPPEPEVHR